MSNINGNFKSLIELKGLSILTCQCSNMIMISLLSTLNLINFNVLVAYHPDVL